MNKLIIGVFLILISQQAASQHLTANSKIRSIQSLYYPLDTVWAEDKNSLLITIKWMDSVIQIQKTIRIKYDLAETRKFRRDSTYNPSPADTL